MNVYQIRLKLFLLKDISINNVQSMITRFIDKSFLLDETLSMLHEENVYKNYCYDLLCPVEKDKIYKRGKIYTLTIRTVDERYADFFYHVCPNVFTRELKGLTAEIRTLPRKTIEFVYTLTPVILKDERGYWKDCMSEEEFKNRININLAKKVNQLFAPVTNECLEPKAFYSTIEFLNRTPVPMQYKNVRLLGDKIRLSSLDDKLSQTLAYFALGVGIGEMNSRGAGFLNYRWL